MILGLGAGFETILGLTTPKLEYFHDFMGYCCLGESFVFCK